MAISTAVDLSAVARVVGIQTVFKDLRGGGILFLPQRAAVVGQGNTASTYSTDKRQVTSATEAASIYGFGSPIHLAVKQLFPVNGDGVGSIPVTVYPLDDDVSGVASAGDVTATGTATESGVVYVKVNNIRSEAIVIASGDAGTDLEDAVTDAINAVLDMPVTAVADGTGNKSDLTSKWKGESANDIVVEIDGEVAGITWAITQPVGGLVNPDVQTALDQVGNVWETMVLNCLNISDTTTLDLYSTFGEGRWGALVRKPLIVFTGNTATTVTLATAVSDARTTDRTNSQLVAPGSSDLPFVTAARQLARIIKVANNNPPRDYGSQDATGLTPGTDAEQWTFADRDSAIKKGSSSIEVKDGVINISDVVTFYHPTGDPVPAYRYVCDIVKLQNIIFNIDLIFATAEWDGAPLIPDDQPTINPEAKKPKSAVAAISAMLDSLGLNAIISDPETAKANTFAEISSTNPKRLDATTAVQLSGNTNIMPVDLNFGFFFGTTTVVA
jgi:phage tail sheath gpL-like